jgi:hypothetical protein
MISVSKHLPPKIAQSKADAHRVNTKQNMVKAKAVPLHAIDVLGWRGDIAPNNS